jgi:hypothetical protein
MATMASQPTTRLRPRVAAVWLALGTLFLLVVPVSADVAVATTIVPTVTDTSVTVSGKWRWETSVVTCDSRADRTVGWAIDWDDPADPGASLGTTGLEVGTADDPLVHTTSDCSQQAQGTLGGHWGPASHRYRSPGTYSVCVVLYDVHIKAEASGVYSRVAAGEGRNRDNSAEDPSAAADRSRSCAYVTIASAAFQQGGSRALGSAGATASSGPAAASGGVDRAQLATVTLIALVLLSIAAGLLFALRQRRSRRSAAGGPQGPDSTGSRGDQPAL